MRRCFIMPGQARKTSQSGNGQTSPSQLRLLHTAGNGLRAISAANLRLMPPWKTPVWTLAEWETNLNGFMLNIPDIFTAGIKMNVTISGSCDTRCKEADICDVNPRFGRSDHILEVSGQSATPSQPCKCALDNTSTRERFKTFSVIGPLDDFQCKLPDLSQPAFSTTFGGFQEPDPDSGTSPGTTPADGLRPLLVEPRLDNVPAIANIDISGSTLTGAAVTETGSISNVTLTNSLWMMTAVPTSPPCSTREA